MRESITHDETPCASISQRPDRMFRIVHATIEFAFLSVPDVSRNNAISLVNHTINSLRYTHARATIT